MSSEFYQSKWFWVAGIAVGLAGLCLLLLRAGQARAEMERRLAEKDKIAQDLLHTMLQNEQGLILKIYAVLKQMVPEDPARQALEAILGRGEELLAEINNQVRNLRDRRSSNDR